MAGPQKTSRPPSQTEPLLPLPDPDQLHLWQLDARPLGDACLARYQGLLSPEEQAQYSRYLLARARREHLAARALLRCCLSRYAAVQPADWRFANQEQGKPEIAGPALGRPLYFNLSHSRELLLCALAARSEIGVDVEQTDRVRQLQPVAQAVLSAAELAALAALPPAEQRQRFFLLWTLKEAYLKARGTGLRLPLRQLSFCPGPSGELSVRFGPQIADDPARWWFASFSPAASYQAAVAYALPPGGRPPTLVSRTLSL